MQWYRRLAEVPGVQYPGSPGIDRTRLLGYTLKPEIYRHNFNGRRSEQLSWPDINGYGSSSASPAWNWSRQLQEEDISPKDLLHRLHEALELPGTSSDYHFAIQICCERLWQYRGDESWVLKEIERLCWLDILLLEATPDTLLLQMQDGSSTYAHSLAFERLIRLYERNGYLAEAIDVAQRATRFHADDSIVKPLQERLVRLEAEYAS